MSQFTLHMLIAMANFLQRNGLAPLIKPLQTEQLDQELRIGVWNIYYAFVWSRWEGVYEFVRRESAAYEVDAIERILWITYFNLPFDEYKIGQKDLQQRVKLTLVSGPWDKFFYLTEEIINAIKSESKKEEIIRHLNDLFEQQNSGFRFVQGILAPVTSPQSIEAIETAFERSSREVRVHLEAAVRHLSNKQAPDYRNSAKESISAIESCLSSITEKKGVDLGKYLVEFKKKAKIHPQLEQALLKLWTYSNESGIRHGLKEGSEEINHAEAKFMLVSASAFIDFLYESAATPV